MDLLITEVTEMRREVYCVAGWCAETRTMVRPHLDHQDWTGEHLSRLQVEPGAIIRMLPGRRRLQQRFPHATEDVAIHPRSVRRVGTWTLGAAADVAPPAAPTLDAAFAGNAEINRDWRGVCKGAHVRTGVRGPSLAGVGVRAGDGLLFSEGDYQGQRRMRAVLFDGVRSYDLPVVARRLRELYREQGLSALHRALPGAGTLHVRLGLARPMMTEPEKCWIMVNGVVE